MANDQNSRDERLFRGAGTEPFPHWLEVGKLGDYRPGISPASEMSPGRPADLAVRPRASELEAEGEATNGEDPATTHLAGYAAFAMGALAGIIAAFMLAPLLANWHWRLRAI